MTELDDLRRAVRELCDRFGTGYWRELEPDRYPQEFVTALTSVLPLQLAELPEELREPFLDGVMGALGREPVLDYVRLNWDATAREP